jgi:LPXTG-motif cell wall-anchored protein
LNAFTGGSHTLTLPTMIGLLALLVFAALFLIRRIQAGGETE